ncbi:MAG: CpsD/CapB family tyrosine-protein kinase [Armatimonadota bacterium]|nr:CpsD/CapB family tyrosine-protein kinase [Armatimonadota bacterium]
MVTKPAELFTTYGEDSPFAEAYRILRVNMLQTNKDLWSLGVTGVQPKHGSSTTAANLGLVMVETAQRVVLVDADLYKPSLHRVFDVPNDVGLSTVLQRHANLQPALRPVSGIRGLRVLPAGPKPKTPMSILQPEGVRQLLIQLRSEADFVIFDLPSVAAVAYTSLIASALDGLLLVVKAGAAPVDVNSMIRRRLHGVNVIGVVLNNVPVTGSELASYSYYGRLKR